MMIKDDNLTILRLISREKNSKIDYGCLQTKNQTLRKGVKSKAPVKAGKEQGVKVPRMVMDSDQPWPRVMRRPFVREAAKR